MSRNYERPRHHEMYINRDMGFAYERDRTREVENVHMRQELRSLEVRAARERMTDQTSRYEPVVRQYLEPIIRNEDRMWNAAKTLRKLDEDRRFLAQQSGAFLNNLQLVSDGPDDNSELETDLESEVESDDENRRLSGASGQRGASGNQQQGFMHWNGFKPYPISKEEDIMGDRQKSFIAMAQEVEVGISGPAVGVTVGGFFGILAKMLMRRDYRAYFKAAAARIILLPDFLSAEPDELELMVYENNLLGTSHYVGNSPLMTCLTYTKDYKYGTITLFKAELARTIHGNWPVSIAPVSVMTKVPTKLLDKIAKSVHRSKRTELRVRNTSTKEPLKWSISDPSDMPRLAHSKSIQANRLSATLQDALGEDPNKFDRFDKRPNVVIATIPEMIAWLHVKASYLKDVRIDGIQFSQLRNKLVGVIECGKGPDTVAHEGKDPRVIVLHPDKGDWATTKVYWR